MALTAVEEAQLRDLIAQQSALLSLAGVEATILSKLGATKVTLSDLPSATAINDADLLLLRQGTTDKSVTGLTFKGLIPTISDASETVKGIVELATNAETQIGTDTVRAVTPAKLRAGLNASGNAPIYACRAWVNFNGTGTVAIRASGNVTSITDNGVGDYTINFTTAMPDANYSVIGMSSYGAISGSSGLKTMMRRDDVAQTVNATRITTALVNSGAVSAASDCLDVNVSIFR